ncbi:MAG: C-type lectin domain-containing protein [Roseburia sp.]|nr:C-type lectin domain-containing protein [Roseburia sp.]MCM1099740.1 C-type lectin domain-containing protein [Ruminococcus flavefaciens]
MLPKKPAFLLCSLLSLSLVSCAGDVPSPETDHARTDQAATQQSGPDELSDRDTEPQSSVETDDTLSAPQDWQSAYLSFLTDEAYADSYTYSLIYVDGDDIPELVIDTGTEAGGCLILTWHGGAPDVLQTNRLNFTFLEKENLLCNSDGNMGHYYDIVYTIQEGKWVCISEGTYGDGEAGVQLDEDGNFIYEYRWNGEDATPDEYRSLLSDVYPTAASIHPERYYIPDEIFSLLETGQVSSANHQYELILRDLTWSEAQAACEEKGGYLATITSREEMERIQEQILLEEMESCLFWVGAANYNHSFHWLEPGSKKAYNMLEYYNALFLFWYDEEPSYTGLTEGGDSVAEDCVALFFPSDKDSCYLLDLPDDLLSARPSLAGSIGYICEYD